MKKRKPRKPSKHTFAYILHDEIFIVEPTYGLTPDGAENLAKWLIKAAKWTKEQEGNK